jgi:hypothetical protein
MATKFEPGFGLGDEPGFSFDDFIDTTTPGLHLGFVGEGIGSDPESSLVTGGSLSGETVTFAGSGIVFNNSYTANVTQAYRNDILAAEQDLASHWTNSVTINVTFDAQAQGQNGNLASNGFSLLEGISYTTLKNALAAHATSADAQAAVASLPATDPSGGVGWALPVAYARMLAITSLTLATDDTVILNTSYNWSYGQDVVAAVEHELSEGSMGRIGALGRNTDNAGHVLWSTMDLFRYSAPGVRDYSDGLDGQAAYFSVDGSTLTLPFNNQYSGSARVNNGDTADYNVLDVFGFGSPGDSLTLSATDIENMNVLGWNPTPPPAVVIESFGTTSLTEIGSNFFLYANGTSTGPELKINGVAVVAGQYGTWAPIAGEQISGGYEVAWKDPVSGDYTVWTTDNNGNYVSSPVGEVSGNDKTLQSLEPSFHQDLNGDGIIGLRAREDFNADSHSDVLWQNTNGTVAIWNSGQPGGAHTVTGAGVVPSSSHIAGTGDFDGNGHADILWQDNNASVFIWDNGQIGGAHTVATPGEVASSWHIVGTGDFNGNGHDDILWQNDNGAVSIWDNGQINGSHIISGAGNVASSWHIVGTGDFDGNGHSDILWQNDNGAVSIWDNGQINSAHIISGAGNVASSWHIVGTGDFDGNGHSDILWHNDNGAVSIWDNGQIGSAHIISGAGNVASSWHIAGTGDFDGNGHDDILWRNDNGAVSIWDNGQIGAAHIVANAGAMLSDWHIA